jgi:hypothetical protein
MCIHGADEGKRSGAEEAVNYENEEALFVVGTVADP